MKRRRVLGALGATGFAAVVGLGIGTKGAVQYTSAQSTETCSDFTLDAEWRETYTSNDQTTLLENTTASSGGQTGEEDTDTEPAIIRLEDVLPEDRGTVGFRLTADPETDDQDTTDVTPVLSINIENRAENGINDPEGDVDTSPGEGELQDFLDVSVWNDTGFLGVDELGAENLEQDFGEPTISEGTLEQVSQEVNDEPLGTIDSTTDESVAVTLRWEFNPDTDSRPVNVTQTDSVLFTFDIGCQ